MSALCLLVLRGLMFLHCLEKGKYKRIDVLSRGIESPEAVAIIDILGLTNVQGNLMPVYLKTCAFHDTEKVRELMVF